MSESKEAMDYLLQLELEEPEWSKLPDDDLRIVKLRLLFSAETKAEPSRKRGKRRKWKKVKMVHKGNERIFNSLDELCNQMNFNKNSVNNMLDKDRKFKGILFYRIYEEELNK